MKTNQSQTLGQADPVHCLLVEDDADMQNMMAGLLREKGLTVTAVAGLVPAVKVLAREKFSLCLLDMHLPDGHGLQLLDHLHKHEPPIPAIVVTAYGDTPTAVKALKQGADNFIDKPVDPPLLYRAIDEALSNPQTSSAATDFIPLPLIGGSSAIKELRRRCLRLRNNRSMIVLSGGSRSGHKYLVEFFSRDNGVQLQSLNSAEIDDQDEDCRWRELLQALLTSAPTDALGMVIIDDLRRIPASVWESFYRTVQRLDRAGLSSQQTRLAILSYESQSKLLESTDPTAKAWVRRTLAILEPYLLSLPPLSCRLDDGEALLQALLRQHLPQGLNLSLSYTNKTRAWLEQFAEQYDLMDLDQYMQSFLKAWPQDSQKEQHFSVPDLSRQDFELLNTLDRFRWNRTRAAKFLGLSLRQIRYRISKLKIGHSPKKDQ